jgi:indolepyruvate ferredoxin oxidoreductase
VKVEARRIAEALFGDHMATNVLALGVAAQAGLLPVSVRALEEAIRLNGTAAEQNLQAFRWGRLAVSDPARVAGWVDRPTPTAVEVVAREAAGLRRQGRGYQELMTRCAGLPEEERRRVAVRAAGLVRYQGLALASSYVDRVLAAFRREREVLGPSADLAATRAVAEGLHRVLAYKDEYEVARLHLEAAMQRRAEQAFTGRVRIHYHLRPPWLRALGVRGKLRVGRWIEPGFRLLAAMRRLRGTPLDLFGLAASRREERRLVGWYQALVDEGLARLSPGNAATVAELLRVADEVRGFEDVKAAGAARAAGRAETLLRALRGEPAAG